MDNVMSYLACFGVLPLFLALLAGFLLHWFFNKLFGGSATGDLSAEGEGALRAEADGLRARIQELEGHVSNRDTDLSSRDGEISDLKSKLAAAAAGAGAAGLAAKAASDSASGGTTADDDETYALEWRNRYLAARVKYLEGRLADAPAGGAKKSAAKKTTAKKRTTAKKTTSTRGRKAAGAATLAAAGGATLAAKKTTRKTTAKKSTAAKKTTRKTTAKKATAKRTAAPKVLYTDGPTDGKPDDLKLIKGIGPKFEKDLNNKGIYYFRQIGNWKKKDVTMVEGVIDSIPGRIERDEWVKQAKGLAKTGGAAAKTTTRKKPGPKPGTKRGATNLDGTPRKKPGPKAGSTRKKTATKKTGTDLDKYYTNVRKFDKGASKDRVESIVKYLGPSLRNRDTSLVACSDATEVATVVKNFGMKKLGLDKAKAEDVVKQVCQDMKSERFKNRVTFYYLCAKKVGKLSVFG